ncbi:alpha/beta hydrolase-fold protein [Winogradskyella maritima]|uniref:Alpha/beta hydrolase n=1 Tax=Winogradskyella maritima TaxID=1517766 RepID=A0ABV8AD49_9FLAO|nr:alpha/beta hydrolase-fold protein [Winogradskyella maritima]
MKKRLLFCMSIIFFPMCIHAQYHNVKTDSIYSVHLKEYRQFQINIPKKYDKADSFDVLYVLDGEWGTSLTKTVYEFLGYAEFIPKNIVIVSIPNYYKDGVNMRRRDFTPVRVKNQPVSKGVINFNNFLKDELIPLINKEVSTNPRNNILYGSSLGGLFTIYSYLEEPTLFKSYISIEPVLRLGDNYLSKVADSKLEQNTDTKNRLWISSRNGKDFEDMGVSKFESILKSNPSKNLDWNVSTYENKTHFSVIWKGLYDGLKFIYDK